VMQFDARHNFFAGINSAFHRYWTRQIPSSILPLSET
jgi:hypothetical protein